jgi:WD40 repeat protein
MELSGHSGEIFAAKFDPTGNLIASGSMDRTISALPTVFGSPDGTLTVSQCSGGHTATAKTTAS